MQETTEYHRRYLRAINNPTRRMILRCLQGGCQTISALTVTTGLDAPTVRWHLDVLEHGFCVEKALRNGDVPYHLTQEGEVINFLDD